MVRQARFAGILLLVLTLLILLAPSALASPTSEGGLELSLDDLLRYLRSWVAARGSASPTDFGLPEADGPDPAPPGPDSAYPQTTPEQPPDGETYPTTDPDG